ncbi:hypothetical protein CBR_g31684 [Chara braunii]|uniref:J domain-containing protein n=1 Tax=Chara braunii TaxID=69332 RepID=A0A388JY17_CHABU|nr:hypothetical protein CBR_g31684 [Chara braunii]|eukprot:GBG62665.1 hypothetical protein CBR_g31684 [Chara braunii]
MPKGKALGNGERRRNVKSGRRKKDVEGAETEEADDISVHSGGEQEEDGESNGGGRSKKGKSSSRRKRRDEDERAKAEDEEVRQEESTEGACKDHFFGGKSLYEVLGVDKTATLAQIRKQYHRMALRLHPDKNPGDESAKQNFQTLQKVFSILGDEEKRKIYDETGSTDDAELSGEKFSNLYEYYRTVYRKVTEDDIVAFERSFRGSDEEAAEVKGCYVRFDGDMEKAFLYIICSREELDSHRFKEIIDAAIAAGELKSYPRYQRWAKQVDMKPPPKDPLGAAEASKKGRAKGKAKAKEEEDSGALVAMIQSRGKDREKSLLEMLEKKYGVAGGPGRKGKGKGPNDRNGGGALSKRGREAGDEEPTEEEFLKARARVLGKASASAAAEEENQSAGKKPKRRKKN